MSLENVHEEAAAERSPAALTSGDRRAGEVTTQLLNVVAFKFGGSSLLGAERMLHAASLVRSAAAASNVTVIVSAMKGVTDHLLSVVHALADGKLAHARREVENLLTLHLDVLRDLLLEEDDALRIRRELKLLGGDLLHEVAAVPVASSEFVVTCENFRDAQPHLEQTRQRGRAVLLPLLEDGIVPVVTGFIG